MSDLGDRFFHSLIKSGSLDDYVRLGNLSHVFEHTESDLEAYQKFADFVTRYGKIPSKSAFKDLIGRDYIKKSKETPKYYYDKIMERHIRSSLQKMGEDANEALVNKKVYDALGIIQDTVAKLNLGIIAPKLYEFGADAHGMIERELKKKKSSTYGITLGWPTFDDMSGSLRGGDVVSIVGRPAQGKTFLLLSSALYTWQKEKKRVLFVSMEMKPILIFERLAAMYEHIPYNWVKLGEFPTYKKDAKGRTSKDLFLNKLAKINMLGLPEFYVVDGDLTATAQDIINLCQQLKPDVVFIDGAYLVELNQGKYFKDDTQKVGKVCEILKNQVATNMDIPVIPSWQLNRESTKIKKSEKAGVEHIAFSDKIGQLSSIVLGLFQEESVETLRQREIRVMKGRSGETGQFSINWDFYRMDFTEIAKIKEYEVQVT